MADEGLTELRRQLGGAVPEGVSRLSDAELRDLAAAVREARHRQSAALAASGERALDHVPRLLRGPIRKVVG